MTPEWFAVAACRDMPTGLFYTDRGAGVDEAKAVCASCPVGAECLAYACTPGRLERIGVWGGMSERERRTYRARLRCQQGVGAVVTVAYVKQPDGPATRQMCGSNAGYMTHRRYHESPCRACKDGHTRDTVRRKADRRNERRIDERRAS